MVDVAELLVGVAATALITGSVVGTGASTLAALGLLAPMQRGPAAAWSFAVGIGFVGWVLFFLAAAGWIAPTILGALAVPASCGVILLRRCRNVTRVSEVGDFAWWVLIVMLVAVLAVDFMEGLSPPADADTLAYHFALPKQFLAAGRLEFVPRAVDGAIPLLIQMTYLAALALGGETGLTLWTMLSGWMAGLLLYVVACRYMERRWALTITLLFLAVPASVYSGGTGHAEPRLALFAITGAIAMSDAVSQRDLRLVALAALAAGFFAAAKYTGLLFVAACATPLLFRWRSAGALALYGAVACLAGFQWYAWNWLHTGDPVFPALWQLLDLPDSEVWTSSQNALFNDSYSAAETPYPRSGIWLFLYPFAATLWPAKAIDSARTGFGPYALLVLPFVLAAIWRYRTHLFNHSLFAVGLACASFYVLWFVTGSSQRVRHLLPVYPLLLICLSVAALRLSAATPLRGPIAAVAGASLCLNLFSQVLFGVGYARHLLGGESRSAFFSRNVRFFDIVPPTETAMTQDDRVLVAQRQLIYLFDRPVYYFHATDEAQVTPRIAQRAPANFLSQLFDRRVTLLLTTAPRDGIPDDTLTRAAQVLERYRCAKEIGRFEASTFASRTLRALDLGVTTSETFSLYRLTTQECRL